MRGMEISWRTLKEHRRSAHIFGEKKRDLKKKNKIDVRIRTTLQGLAEKLVGNNQVHLFSGREI